MEGKLTKIFVSIFYYIIFIAFLVLWLHLY